MTREILNKTSNQIATEYRSLKQFVLSLPSETRWQYGRSLSLLRNAFIVAKEAEQIRST